MKSRPADVPLPPGQLQGATGGAGRWSLLLLVDGPADQARASTVPFYRAHGFVAETDSILHDATHLVTVAVEARDHSPRRPFVAVPVGPRPAAAAGDVAPAARLTGQARGRATVTFAGARAGRSAACAASGDRAARRSARARPAGPAR